MIFFIILFLASTLYADVYSLSDCIEFAKRNNPVLRAYYQRKQATFFSRKSTKAFLYPQITGEFSFSHLNETPQMSVDFMGTKQDFEIGSQNTYQAKLSLIQPLFTGGKLKSACKIGDLTYRISNMGYRFAESNLILSVKMAYFGAILSKNFLKIRKEAEDFLKENLEVSKKLFNQGRVSSYDVSRNEVAWQLSKSERIEAENSFRIALENLKKLTGIRIEDVKDEFKEPQKLEYDVDLLVDFALKNNLQIKIKKQEIKIQEFSTLNAKSNFFPQIYLGAGYVYENPHYSVEQWGKNWNVFVNLNWNIFSSGRDYYNVKKQNNEKLAGLSELDDLKQKIKVAVKSEIFNLQSSYDRYLSHLKNLETAKENLKIAKERYNRGILSHLELKDAQVSLTSAEIQKIKAIYDFNVARIKLLNLLGVRSFKEVEK